MSIKVLSFFTPCCIRDSFSKSDKICWNRSPKIREIVIIKKEFFEIASTESPQNGVLRRQIKETKTPNINLLMYTPMCNQCYHQISNNNVVTCLHT